MRSTVSSPSDGMLRLAIVLGLSLFGVGVSAAACRPIPLDAVANASRIDAVAADGRGGWLDLGSDDLSSLPSGPGEFAGVTFDVAPCADENAKSCLILGRSGVESVELPVAAGIRGGRLYLLHALANARSPESLAPVAAVRLVYADGGCHESELCVGRDAGEWTSARSFDNAVCGWSEYNGHTQVSLFVSGFELDPSRELKSVVFKSKGVCAWMVVAASTGRDVVVKGLRLQTELSGTFSAPPPPASELRRFPVGARPKNVILVIGDGMGSGSIRMASLYRHGREGALFMQQLPVAGLCLTRSADSAVTDSAAAGTALATGSKTSRGVVGLGIVNGEERKHPRKLVSVAEEAHARGQAVAIMTNDRLTGATPAAFYAHVSGRGQETQIAEEAAGCGFEVLIGCRTSAPWFRLEAAGGRRSDGRDLVAGMEGAGYCCVTSLAELVAAPRSKKVIGFGLDETMGELSLAEAAKAVLSRIGDSPKGFFMMCESATPDHSNHRNNPSGSVLGVMQVDWTVAAAIEFAERRGDTLVVVTADHETGGLSAVRSHSGGKLTLAYTATDHTGMPVEVYAYGPGAERFEGLIDNTDLGLTLKEFMASSTGLDQ